MDQLIYITPLFFLTALVYASVGFGGGSTYLALLVLSNLPYQSIPRMALILNLVVVTGGLYHYIKNRQLSFKTALPFAVTSVPMAYLGGRMAVGKTLFLILLGLSLLCAGLRLLISKGPSLNPPSPPFFKGGGSRIPPFEKGGDQKFPPLKKGGWGDFLLALSLGAPLGFLSGLTGIGGGIFLAPVLYLMKWGTGRQIAAASCFFIFVNSAAGLIGQFSKDWAVPVGAYSYTPLLIAAVFLGGQIGTRLSLGKLSQAGLQRITAVLILFVAGRIFWGFYKPIP